MPSFSFREKQLMYSSTTTANGVDALERTLRAPAPLAVLVRDQPIHFNVVATASCSPATFTEPLISRTVRISIHRMFVVVVRLRLRRPRSNSPHCPSRTHLHRRRPFRIHSSSFVHRSYYSLSPSFLQSTPWLGFVRPTFVRRGVVE